MTIYKVIIKKDGAVESSLWSNLQLAQLVVRGATKLGYTVDTKIYDSTEELIKSYDEEKYDDGYVLDEIAQIDRETRMIEGLLKGEW